VKTYLQLSVFNRYGQAKQSNLFIQPSLLFLHYFWRCIYNKTSYSKC